MNGQLHNLSESNQAILKILIDDGKSSAETLATKLKVHPSVTRRHLKELEAKEFVLATFEKAPKGRPHKLFSIGVRGRDALFGKYDLILDLMADTVIKFRGRENAISLFTSMAENFAAANSNVHRNGDSDINLLRSLGFEPERRTDGPIQLLISKNCPILQLSKKYPELTCDAFHTVFLKRLERVQSVRLRQTIARGADECVHEMSGTLDE